MAGIAEKQRLRRGLVMPKETVGKPGDEMMPARRADDNVDLRRNGAVARLIGRGDETLPAAEGLMERDEAARDRLHAALGASRVRAVQRLDAGRQRGLRGGLVEMRDREQDAHGST